MSKRSRTLAFAPLDFRHKNTWEFVKIRDLIRLNQYFIVLYFMKIPSNRRNKRPNPASIRLNCSKSSGFSFDLKTMAAMFTFMSKDKEFLKRCHSFDKLSRLFSTPASKTKRNKNKYKWQKNEGVRCSHT